MDLCLQGHKRSHGLVKTHVQSADNDPFMPDADREGLNTVRLSRGDDIIEARAAANSIDSGHEPRMRCGSCIANTAVLRANKTAALGAACARIWLMCYEKVCRRAGECYGVDTAPAQHRLLWLPSALSAPRRLCSYWSSQQPSAAIAQIKHYPGTYHGFAIRGDKRGKDVRDATIRESQAEV